MNEPLYHFCSCAEWREQFPAHLGRGIHIRGVFGCQHYQRKETVVVKAAGRQFQDPADKVKIVNEGDLRSCCRERCEKLAELYDRIPGENRWLCKEHRTWSWAGAWETQRWSLRLEPKPTPEWWRWYGVHMNTHGWNEETQEYDVNLILREIKKYDTYGRKIDIVLPSADWLLEWAEQEKQRRAVAEARHRLERAIDSAPEGPA